VDVTDKVREIAGKFRGFVDGVSGEVRRTSWPARQELIESTLVVISMVVALAAFLWVCDRILISLLQWVTPRG
jgi:preprotein translocase subunit SecE